MVCLLLGVKGVLYFCSCAVDFQVYYTFLQSIALYRGLIMFSGFLFHSFPSFLKYYFGFCLFVFLLSTEISQCFLKAGNIF